MSFEMGDPWMPLSEQFSAALHTGVSANYTTGNWAVANQASYIPVVFPADATLYALYTRSTSATGTYDLGFFDPDMNRISSNGSTANANAILTHTLAEISVLAGYTYWAGLVYSGTTGFYRSIVDDQFQMDSMELAQESSALPLPATMTPVRNTTTQIPIIAFGVR